MLLTKHEGETFHNQTVYISGQAFIRCKFIACTLILRETLYHLQECTFERCNWHVDWVLMWGSPESLREIKALVSLIEQAQVQLPSAEQQALQSNVTAATDLVALYKSLGGDWNENAAAQVASTAP